MPQGAAVLPHAILYKEPMTNIQKSASTVIWTKDVQKQVHTPTGNLHISSGVCFLLTTIAKSNL
jgi:hypothetical protein